MDMKLWILILAVVVGAITFGGSPMAAQNLCDQTYFCDRDGDGFFKDHHRCGDCGGVIDCDDDSYDESNLCDGPGEQTTLMAELTGAFKFPGIGPEAFTMNTLGNQAYNDLPITLQKSDGLPSVWADMFSRCPELLSGAVPDEIRVEAGNATIAKASEDIRIYFDDFEMSGTNGRPAIMSLYLIGTTDQPNGELGQSYSYVLDTFAIYGHTVAGGGQGRRLKCQHGNEPLNSVSSYSFVDVSP